MTAEEWCDLFHAEQRVSQQFRKENEHLRQELIDLQDLIKGWTRNMERALKASIPQRS